MGRVQKMMSFASHEQYARFAEIAQSLELSASGLCQQIADGVVKAESFSAAQLNALLRGIVLLLEANEIESARILCRFGVDQSAEYPELRSAFARLGDVGVGVVGEIHSLIEKRQGFAVESSSGKTYHCRYADFWLPQGGRPQLRTWVEEAKESDEPPELAHNRIFRLDRIQSTCPITAEWRFQGLDTIPVVLEIQPGFRYTPHLGDVVTSSGDKTLVTRLCWSVFWLLQDIARYGDCVRVVSPDIVQQRVVNLLQRQLELYGEGE